METYVQSRRVIATSILVAALGYFVDIYDLLLFSIVRIPSLKALGVPDADLLSKGVLLLNMQMGGMLLGGLLWGIWGDKRGRLSVLFGSIFLYSVANIANGFVTSVEVYAVLRFIAGVGLAGELGAGITLVSEIMPKETRGYGTMIVASIGVLGAVVAALVGDYFDWRTAFFVGGGLGLALLILRIGVFESGMFNTVKEKAVSRGNFLSLFHTPERAIKYLSCIGIGMPLWFVVGILMTLAPEFGTALHMSVLPTPGKAIMFCYIGLAIGDFGSGLISQIMRSRKKVVLGFIILTGLFVAAYLVQRETSLGIYYFICLMLGVGAGYWAIFVTVASEQFGTNIRATVTTTVPNFVRGSLIPLTLAFGALRPSVGIIYSAAIVGGVTFLIALVALRQLDETYGKELDYLEE